MSIPASVISFLDQQNIEYQEIDSLPSAAPIIVSSLVHIAGVKTQLLYCSQALISHRDLSENPDEINALSRTDYSAFINKHGLDHIPALPGFEAIPCIVDKSIFDIENVLLDSGTTGSLIQISPESLKSLCDAASQLSQFSTAIKSIEFPQGISDEEQLSQAVSKFTDRRIKARLEDTMELPPLPQTAERIIKLRVDPNADVAALSEIVELDPPLAAQVVTWASSSFYAAPGKIQSVSDAIGRVLGFDLVLNLSLGLSLGKMLKVPSDHPEDFTPYWQQAVFAATAADRLARLIPSAQRPVVGLSYLSALLHNFGFLVIASVFPPHFSAICRLQELNPHVNHRFIEQHIIDVTREQIAGWLMESWAMPDEVVTGIRHQNDSSYDGEDSAYANLIFIAMRLLRQHGIGDAPPEIIPAYLFEHLNLDPQAAHEAIAELVEASGDLCSLAKDLAA